MTQASHAMRLGAVCLAVTIFAIGPASSRELTNDAIRKAIVQESRQAYYQTGHPCACPEDSARNGSRCGKRSAYSRPGGATPHCYPSDVTKSEIDDYKAEHK